MNPPPVPPPRDGAPATGDQRCKDAGLQVIMRLAATVRVGRAYQTDNQVFRQQLDALLAVIAPLLEESGEVVLVALAEDLYLNGVRIPVKTSNYRFHKSVHGEFQRRNIAGLRVQKGIKDEEFITFFRLFLKPDLYQGPELLAACLARGVDHIAPAIHASTEAPEYQARSAPGPWRALSQSTTAPATV